MNFVPFPGKIVIEPLNKEGIILSDDQKYEEMGTVIKGSIFTRISTGEKFYLVPGDIVFFLAYGIEQTPEYEGKTYYVVPCDERFIIGKIPCTTNEASATTVTYTTTVLTDNSSTVSKNSAFDVKTDSSSTIGFQTESTSPTTNENA